MLHKELQKLLVMWEQWCDPEVQPSSKNPQREAPVQNWSKAGENQGSS